MKDESVILFPMVPHGAFQFVSKNLRKSMVDVLQRAKEMLAPEGTGRITADDLGREIYICYALNRIESDAYTEPMTVAACLRAKEFIEQSLGDYSTLGSWVVSTPEYESIPVGKAYDWYAIAAHSRPVWIDAIIKELKNA